MKPLALGVALALTVGPASAGTTGLLERNFSRDWAKADTTTMPAPATPASEPAPTEGPIHAEHSPIAHMYITQKAFELYASQYDSTELARFMGGASNDRPDPDNGDTVVAGSYDEDSPNKNPWGETIPELRHFWDCRKGPKAGLYGYDSSVDRSQKYFTGGFGLDGAYDEGWGSGGTKGDGVLNLYRSGNKAQAFYYLGHAAHLLEDLTVPAHALLFPHPFSGDAYESFMKTHHSEWPDLPSAPRETFATLYDLYYRTGDTTNDFDAGRSASSGADGKKDRGARRARGFTDADLRAEGDVLMPLAYQRVADLFLYFYRQVDTVPPRVRMAFPRAQSAAAPDPVEGLRATLRASATDEESGVDRHGYRFEYATWTGASWSAWRQASTGPTGPALELALDPGTRYAVRVFAVDAAGNRAVSAAAFMTTESAVARLP